MPQKTAEARAKYNRGWYERNRKRTKKDLSGYGTVVTLLVAGAERLSVNELAGLLEEVAHEFTPEVVDEFLFELEDRLETERNDTVATPHDLVKYYDLALTAVREAGLILHEPCYN